MLVSDKVRNERLSACNSCKYKREVLGVNQCKVCKCVIALKTKFDFAECPKNKWNE